MEQSVCMSLPDARPIAHLLLNSSVTARAAVVPRPNNKAPAKADVMFLRIGFVLGFDLIAAWKSARPSHEQLFRCPEARAYNRRDEHDARCIFAALQSEAICNAIDVHLLLRIQSHT